MVGSMETTRDPRVSQLEGALLPHTADGDTETQNGQGTCPRDIQPAGGRART